MQPQAPQPVQQPPSYDFIMNAPQPSKGGPKLPGSQSSMLVRIAISFGVLILLFIAFSVVKTVLKSGSNTSNLLAVAQDQQEIIHLATAAIAEPSLTPDNLNLAATTKLSVTSSDAKLLSYMATEKLKFKPELLYIKVTTANDTALRTSAQASTYNETYKRIMQTQLEAYARDLTVAYNKTKGPAGRALLGNAYQQAKLLSNQLVTNP